MTKEHTCLFEAQRMNVTPGNAGPVGRRSNLVGGVLVGGSPVTELAISIPTPRP